MLVFLLKIIEKCEIVLSRPTEYFYRSEIALLGTEWNIPNPRLHYFGPHSTSAFVNCTISADGVLPHSEIVLLRPT